MKVKLIISILLCVLFLGSIKAQKTEKRIIYISSETKFLSHSVGNNNIISVNESNDFIIDKNGNKYFVSKDKQFITKNLLQDSFEKKLISEKFDKNTFYVLTDNIDLIGKEELLR